MTGDSSKRDRNNKDVGFDDGQRDSDCVDGSRAGSLNSGTAKSVKHSDTGLEDLVADEMFADVASAAQKKHRAPIHFSVSGRRDDVPRREQPQQGSAAGRLRELRQAAQRRRANHRIETARVRRSLPMAKRTERRKRPEL